jgi:hypothetical protein
MVACLQEARVTPKNYESKSCESQKGAAVPEKRPSLYVPVEKDPFEGFSVGKLKKIAQDSCVDVSDCVEKRQIYSRLQEAGIKRKNYEKKIRNSQKNIVVRGKLRKSRPFTRKRSRRIPLRDTKFRN